MNEFHSEFEKSLKNAGIDDETINKIINVSYQENGKKEQDNVNYFAAVMAKCDKLLDFNDIAETMSHMSCCKSGFRLENAKKIAKKYSNDTLEKKLELLGQQKYMGKPHLTENGDIYTEHCAGSGTPDDLKCSCWKFKGKIPTKGKMPSSYCLCCAGHFRFHYEKALGVKLRVKEIVSSIFSDPPQYCSFLFEIVEDNPKKKQKS